MRNSTIIFVLLGLIIVGTLIFTFYFLPKLDASSNNLDLSMELPVQRSDMRYIVDGVVPFCTAKSTGLQIEVRERASVISPIDGIVDDMQGSKVTIKSEDGVLVYLEPLTNINVSIGDYVISGDIVGSVDGTSFDFGLDNYKDSRYECPFLYLNEEGKKVITNGLKESVNVKSKPCECSYLNY